MRSTVCSLLAIGLCALCAVSLAAADPDIRSLLDGGHFKQARALLEPRVKANPSDAEAAAALARVRVVYGEMDKALQLAETAVRLKPDVAQYHWQLAQIVGNMAEKATLFRQLGLARRFRQEAETTIKLDPKHIEARLATIAYFIKAPGILGGDRKKADDMVEEIARIDPGASYLARAQVLRDTDTKGGFGPLYQQAAAAAKMPAVKIDATTTLVNWYLGQKPPRYDAAEPLAHTLISLDPHRLVGYRMLATVYTAAARWPELDAMLADAEKAVPDDLGAHYAAARTTIADGNDFPRAERLFRRYLGQEPEVHEPTLAQAHWRLGNVLEKEGRRADAVAEFEQAVKLTPDFEEAKKDLARVRASR